MSSCGDTNRHVFLYQGRVIYSWTQTLTDVDVYIPEVPAGVRARDLHIEIQPSRVVVGIGTSDRPYLDHDLTHTVRKDSVWTFDPDSREIHISLVKALPSTVWSSVFVGHERGDETAIEADRKQLLLERFQEDHPGFDFRDAEITGNVPDPATFLRDS